MYRNGRRALRFADRPCTLLSACLGHKFGRHQAAVAASQQFTSLHNPRVDVHRQPIEGHVASQHVDTTNGHQSQRHILRALLRESTYLPDNAAQAYIKAYIIARYRRYQDRTTSTGKLVPLAISRQRLASLHLDARKGLKRLRLANQGASAQLIKVLRLTYGRRGKQRHELLRPAKRGEASDPTQDPIIHMIKARNLPEAIIAQIPHLTESQKALFSAARHNASLIGASSLKRKPRIPEQNTWLRGFPVKRLKNKIKDWYANVLRSLPAPLSTSEFDQLRNRAAGYQEGCGLRRRRKLGTCGVLARENAAENRSCAAQLETDYEHLADMLRSHGTVQRRQRKPAHIGPRFMRRKLGNVLSQSCQMAWDSEEERWNVTWGSARTETNAQARKANAILGSMLTNEVLE